MDNNFKWFKWYTPKVRILCHVLFWILVTLLIYLNYKRLGGDYIWIFILKELFVTTTLFYSLSAFFSRRTFRSNVFALLLFAVVSYLWWVFWTYVVCYLVVHYFPKIDSLFDRYLDFILSNGFFSLFSFDKFSIIILDFIYLISIPLSPKLVKLLMEQVYEKTKLERDNLAIELNFLKSQISPHFLFNTLNNIYRMSEKNDPATPGAVFRLANLMRYILYEAKDEEIPLSKEVEFIKNYVELAKIRFGESGMIKTDIAIGEEPYKIVPLLLIPFVENAFKHGPERSRKNAWLTVELKMDDNHVIMEVKNGVNNSAAKRERGGVGLENVLRRLELHYPQRHDLKIMEEEDKFCVKLVIDLKEKTTHDKLYYR